MRLRSTERIKRATSKIIPPKTPCIIKCCALLSSNGHLLRWLLPPLALLASDPCNGFAAPTLLRLGPMTAFAGIFVQRRERREGPCWQMVPTCRDRRRPVPTCRYGGWGVRPHDFQGKTTEFIPMVVFHYQTVIGVDHNKCSERLVILRFSIFFRPIRSTIVRFVPVLHYVVRVSEAFRPHSFLERQM
jgi:hypothetical protein